MRLYWSNKISYWVSGFRDIRDISKNKKILAQVVLVNRINIVDMFMENDRLSLLLL